MRDIALSHVSAMLVDGYGIWWRKQRAKKNGNWFVGKRDIVHRVWDKDTEKVFEPPFKPSIGIIEDPGIKVSGPIWVKGGIRIEGADGKSYEVRNRVTLCRCGQSSNKPFCDGTHASMHFCDGIPLEKGKGEW